MSVQLQVLAAPTVGRSPDELRAVIRRAAREMPVGDRRVVLRTLKEYTAHVADCEDLTVRDFIEYLERWA